MPTTTQATPETLQAAFDGSYYTILGCGGELSEWTNGLTEIYADKGVGTITEFFSTTGKDVNEFAAARGEVAAPDRFVDDLTILMFPLDGLDASKLAIFRIFAGDVWFDDLVNNMVIQPVEDADADE